MPIMPKSEDGIVGAMQLFQPLFKPGTTLPAFAGDITSYMMTVQAIEGITVPTMSLRLAQWHNELNHDLKLTRDSLHHDTMGKMGRWSAWIRTREETAVHLMGGALPAPGADVGVWAPTELRPRMAPA
jgi:hypothetical protein